MQLHRASAQWRTAVGRWNPKWAQSRDGLVRRIFRGARLHGSVSLVMRKALCLHLWAMASFGARPQLRRPFAQENYFFAQGVDVVARGISVQKPLNGWTIRMEGNGLIDRWEKSHRLVPFILNGGIAAA